MPHDCLAGGTGMNRPHPSRFLPGLVASILPIVALAQTSTPVPPEGGSAQPAQPSVAGEDRPALIARVKSSVVTILVYDAEGNLTGQGIGFFAASGVVRGLVTSRHVVVGADHADVKLASGKALAVAGVLAEKEALDLILLSVQVDEKDTPPLVLSPVAPREGERVVVVGSPMGLAEGVSEGIVSAVRHIPGVGRVIQTTAAIPPGSSGSPVLNMQGRVVAVASEHLIGGQALNFAVAAEAVRDLKPHPLRTVAAWSAGIEGPADRALRLGGAALAREDYESALPLFQEAARIDPHRSVAWSSVGYCLDALGRHEEAIEAWQREIRIKPDDAGAHYNLGVAYGSLGRYQEEVAAYKEAIRIEPDFAGAYNNLGVAYEKLARHEDAIGAFRQAIRVRPGDAVACNNLGVAYYELRRYEEAAAAHEEAIRINPDYAEAHCNLGADYERLGRYSEEVAACLEALRIKPDLGDAHFNLGVACVHLGRWREAAEAFAEAVRIKPDDAGGHYMLGFTFLLTGDKAAALDECRILEDLDANLAHTLFDMIHR
jgi:tetratricopeptide (TPR) repeat protein